MGRKQILQRNYDDEGNLISKECSCCHEVKPVSEFNECKSSTDGLHSACKECRKKYRQENKEKIKEYKKQYRQENKEKIKEYKKQYRKDNAEKIKEHHKKYRQDNAEKLKDYNKQYYKDNSESLKKYRQDNTEKLKDYNKQYYKDNSEYYKEYRKQYYKDNSESIKEHNNEYRKQYNIKKVQEALQQIKIEVESNPDKYNYITGKEIYGIIYLVHNIKSDKYYVGQSINSFDIRYPSGWLYEHGYKNSVKHDLELYGEESFKYTKLFKVAHSQYELDKLEAYYIDYYNSYENGYNETRGNIFTDRGKKII